MTARGSSRAPSAAAHGTREPVEIVHHDRSAPATVGVAGHDRRDRLRRAILALMACWGAAIAAVFLPVLHFVLVPSLLAAGPLLAWSRLRQRRTLLDVHGACPACGAELREPLGRDTMTPIELRCGACRRALSVSLPEHLRER